MNLPGRDNDLKAQSQESLIISTTANNLQSWLEDGVWAAWPKDETRNVGGSRWSFASVVPWGLPILPGCWMGSHLRFLINIGTFSYCGLERWHWLEMKNRQDSQWVPTAVCERNDEPRVWMEVPVGTLEGSRPCTGQRGDETAEMGGRCIALLPWASQ